MPSAAILSPAPSPTWDEAVLLAAQSHPTAFARVTKRNYRPAPFHWQIGKALLDVAAGRCDRLMIFVPPRHGKSELVSVRFPAWYLGRNPDKRVIATSYGADLAEDFGRQARDVMASDDYGRIFPGITLARDTKAAGHWEVAGRFGGYVAAGVGGPITGRGAHCFPAGTMVETTYGPIAIEHLIYAPSSCKILAYDTRTARLAYRGIEAFSRREADGLYRITTTGGRVVTATGDHRFYVGGRFIEARRLAAGDPLVCLVSANVRATRVCSAQEHGTRLCGHVLRENVLRSASCCETSPDLPDLRETDRTQNERVLSRVSAAGIWTYGCVSTATGNVPDVQHAVRREVAGHSDGYVRDVLQQGVRGSGPFASYGWYWQPEMEARCDAIARAAPLREGVSRDAAKDSRTGRVRLCGVSCTETVACASSGQLADEQCGQQSGNAVRGLPSYMAWVTGEETAGDTVALVERLRGAAVVYDIQVADHHTFFANGICVHNCLLIDDPIKNREEAESQTYRDNVWNWYTSTAYTRLEEQGAIILIQTRWHESDLAGRLLAAQAQGGDQWRVVELPAMQPDGAPLWPEKYDRDALQRIRSVISSRDWAALYQQRPRIEEGNLFKRHWWRVYRDIPAHITRVAHYVDGASKTGLAHDYSVIATWGQGSAGYYLLDLWRGRVEFPELEDRARLHHAQWRTRFPGAPLVIEDKASGTQLLQSLRRPFRTRTGHDEPGLPVLPWQLAHHQSAMTQAEGVTALVEAGHVYLPEYASWLHDFIDEHAAAPSGTHDDMVTTTGMALTRMSRKTPPGPPQYSEVKW